MAPKLAKAVAASRAERGKRRSTPYEDASCHLTSGVEWLHSWNTKDLMDPDSLENLGFGLGQVMGVVVLPEGIFEFYTQGNGGWHETAYSKLSIIRDRTLFTRTFDRQYSPRHMKTLAKKWAKELG